jgi:hypothetical protein
MMRLRVASPDHRPVRLWLPLVLVWLLLAFLLALPLLVAVLVDLVLWLAGARYHHYSTLIVATLGLLGEIRGTVIRIKDDKTDIHMTID